MSRKFTGWHMAAILVAFFAVVIVVNFTMAFHAVRGFGGVVVENSYVASQHFNSWLEEQRREDAFGWRAQVTRAPDGRIVVETSGVPADADLVLHLRRPIGRPDDRTVVLRKAGDSRYVSQAVEQGRWIVRLDVTSDGLNWAHEVRI